MGVDSFESEEVEHGEEEIAHVLRCERTDRHAAVAIGEICVDDREEKLNGSLALVFGADLLLQSGFEDVRVELFAVVFYYYDLFKSYVVGDAADVAAHLFACAQAATALD